MEPRQLYFDESGFTGYNLLDEIQPVFAIASTDLDPNIARDLLRESFPKYKGKEFKFSKLWKLQSHRGCFPQFGQNVGTFANRIFVWRVDKKFAILTKMVDFLVEPIAREAGYDFYANGFSLNYTNHIHFGLTQLYRRNCIGICLRHIRDFSRNPTHNGLRNLQLDLERLGAKAGEPMKGFLDFMALGARHFTRYFSVDRFKGSDELQLTSMVAIVGHWRNLYDEDFEVVQDSSSNFFHRLDEWENITSSNVPSQYHPSASGVSYRFPLRVVTTNLVDSKDYPAIQLCDVLAGLATRAFRKNVTGADRKILNSTIEAGLGNIQMSGIAPEDFDPYRLEPQQRDGPDSVDLMAEIMSGRHNSVMDAE